jgi:gliding motility-associated-like protein
VATYTTPSLLTGCDSTTTLNLTVNALPAITTQPVNATTLVNGSANFTIAASGTGPLTYQWQVNTGSGFTTITDGGVYSNSTTASLTISNATLSMNGYSYQCIVSGVCTPAATSNSAVLTVNLNPQTVSAPFANGSTVVLTYGDAAVSAAATASSGLPVTYSSSDATVATIDATGGITITGAGTTQITVSQSGNDTYLAAATSFTVQVNKKDLLITANDITRPYGESNPPLTMQYSGFVYGQNPSVITPPLLSTAVVTTTLPGAYLIALAGGSAANYNLVLNNGTFTVTGAEVNINKQPDDNSACAGQEAAFKTGATAVSPLVTLGYQWQQSTNGSGWQDISGATADTCIVSNSNSLYVRCLVTAPGTNLYTQAALFTVNPLPAVQAAKSNDLDCNRGSADLMASGAVNYTWSPATGLSNPHIANPVATPAGDMTYIVTGTDDHGCRNTDSIQVKVTTIREGENVMANAFTPNGDGNNDCFGIRYWGAVQSIQFDVYNRYGALVFHSTTPGACWDGRSGGQDQPAGTYVYFIHAVTQCGVINRKGTVTLIR